MVDVQIAVDIQLSLARLYQMLFFADCCGDVHSSLARLRQMCSRSADRCCFSAVSDIIDFADRG